MKIFSGSSNLPLAEKICKNLSTSIGKIELKSFPSGEKYAQFLENIRGEDVFLLQSGSFPVNDNLMEILIMVDAAKRASAGRITVVCPVFFYQRQERKDKGRVPISAKLVMDLFKAAGVNRILTMDLHAAQIGGFTNIPIDCLTFKPTLVNVIKNLGIEAVVAPDIGAVKKADEYAALLKCELVIISKQRKSDTEVFVKHFMGDVAGYGGKKVIIIDDICESAGTLIEAAISCKEHGAKEIYCGISHACFTEIGYDRLKNNFGKLINGLFASNSISSPIVKALTAYDRFKVVDISLLFAEAIYNIHNNKSVSQLFS